MIIAGTGLHRSNTRSQDPFSITRSRHSAAISRMRGSNRATASGVNSGLRILRNGRQSGGSISDSDIRLAAGLCGSVMPPP